ncbi:MAG: hypothetical protein N3B21_18855 [Clostridia bacterium]|nr:hypothetical protein [Clostridia bacterium]
MNTMKLKDIFLLPKGFYQRITDSRGTLYAGIILVGIKDVVYTLIDAYPRIFAGKAQAALVTNIALAAVLVLLIGLIDVIFFSKPLADLFRNLSEDKGSGRDNLIIRLMKIYIIANLMMIPLEIILATMSRSVGSGSLAVTMQYVAILLFLVELIWFNAIIARGVNAVYKFKFMFNRLVFIVVFVWNYLIFYALGYLIEKGITLVFK